MLAAGWTLGAAWALVAIKTIVLIAALFTGNAL